MKFNFEKNLTHQETAIKSTISVFDDLNVSNTQNKVSFINPVINQKIPFDSFYKNVKKLQLENGIEDKINKDSNIIDIMMETGTGKTYTYTKTIFELNKKFGIFKFIVLVPTLSIKAGTIDFLKSESSRDHFNEQYKKPLNIHIVESQKNGRSKKSFIPAGVVSFVNAQNNDNAIQVLIINSGMINSETMQKSFDKRLFDTYSVPFDALAALHTFLIIDEPHKFAKDNKTWSNIEKLKPQYILRYGATFPDIEIKKKNVLGTLETIKVKDYHNLIYQLTAVDSFNRNLVKGIIGHITEFEGGKNAFVKFIDSDGILASFELIENNEKPQNFTVSKNESLSKVHVAMTDLFVENINKSTLVLSNGMELKKGDKINPYSYVQTLQELMIKNTIKHHFELEKQLLTKTVKIKPLTLFFIDNIEEYRKKDGFIRLMVEQYIKAEVENQLKIIDAEEIKDITKIEKNIFYKSYLQKTLFDLSLTHGGYFSKDNSEKDEAIEKEINEILHDKQAMLDLQNPRRFIFSKWTLREGWDNPNVFQICKLRSSGSEISKLQEVGRGLRLPVNEFGSRVKDDFFYLNYFVDFTETDFVDKLVSEINQKSGAFSIDEVLEKLPQQMIKQIMDKYDIKNEDDLIDELVDKKVIRASYKFLEGGQEYIKENYELIFEGVNSNKVRKSTDSTKTITVRTEKYHELKNLWEKLNEKVILEYKFKNESAFQNLFSNYIISQKNNFTIDGIRERKSEIEFKNNLAVVKEEESVFFHETTAFSNLKYSDFLKQLSRETYINIHTIHQSFIESNADLNNHLNNTTIRIIKQNFDYYLMANAIDKFSITYKKVTNRIHPTKLTDELGVIKNKISAADVGNFHSDEKVSETYFFDELFFDSDLEKTNIKKDISEVIIFTKIPKNSIQIPVAGGKSYTPDFAYVLNFKNGDKKLHFIVETKNVGNENILREEERFKIKHAEKFFEDNIEIKFKTQFSNQKIVDLINEIMVK